MRILFCGDYIAYNGSLKSNDNPFGDFKEIIQNADISLYNQEFPITNISNKYPTKKYGLCAKTSPSAIDNLRDSGFNIATLANNHIFNYGINGVIDTKNYLKKIGIKTVGAGKDLKNALKPLYVTQDNYKIAFLNFAENEFNTATDYHGGANPYDIINILKSINEVKQEANYIFLIIHGGIDYCKIPSSRVVKAYRFFAEQGVSAIIGHHTHVVSGYEVYNGVPIFYGIGNFIPGKIVNKNVLYSFPVEFYLDSDVGLKFKGYPLKFNNDKKQLKILKGQDLNIFIKEQNEISDIIKNPQILKSTLKNNYLTKERESYYFTLFTRSSYLLFKIFRKIKLINYYHKYMIWKMKLNKKNSAMWNIFRCETHQDVLDLIYEKHIDTYNNE